MKKVLLILMAVICMYSFTVSAEEADYTEQSVKVISGGEECGELMLRFYSDKPHIPYMGINEYSQFVRQQPLSVTENEDGTYALKNWNEAEMICDAQAGSIYIQDWNAFFALPMPLEDKAAGLKDSTVHYARVTDITYAGEAKPVMLDLAKYGIAIYSDGNDVYFPVSTLTNIMTDIATNYLLYNGEDLYFQRFMLDEGSKGFFGSEFLQAQMRGGERPEDVIRQCYADICLDLDNFFGHPGRAPLDEALAQNGLDGALSSFGDEGQQIKDGLFSPDLAEYINAMTRLLSVYLGDGHTFFVSGVSMLQDPDIRSEEEFAERLSAGGLILMENPILLQQSINEIIPLQRSTLWGKDTYREYGNTAIIRLDSFMPDEAGWESFYKGEGELPEDSLGIVVSGLRKASENPDIRNILFDLTCNNGGSPDVMMAILAMTTGQNQLYGENVITGQKMTVTFETDANFDKVFDEKDKEVIYDYNYGALVSRHAFSCGNLFPIVLQEAGGVLIGEPSSGGSCCIQIGTDAEGLCYLISSGQWRLTDSEGTIVEGGCSIDMPIEPVTSSLVNNLVSIFGFDTDIPAYTNYYVDEKLDEMMNDWFGDAAQSDLAA